jgi:hypothetical protein
MPEFVPGDPGELLGRSGLEKAFRYGEGLLPDGKGVRHSGTDHPDAEIFGQPPGRQEA